jgi:hypothetical protein
MALEPDMLSDGLLPTEQEPRSDASATSNRLLGAFGTSHRPVCVRDVPASIAQSPSDLIRP